MAVDAGFTAGLNTDDGVTVVAANADAVVEATCTRTLSLTLTHMH